MNSPQPTSPRQRLQALLAIPEGQRTDAQWDELNELEIELASGNRQGAPQQQGARQNQNVSAPAGQQGQPGQQRPGGGPNARKFRRFHKRRPNGEGV
jgi:hypothetical protein